MRVRITLLAAPLVLAVTLTACGGGEADDGNAGGGVNTPPPTAGGTARPETLPTAESPSEGASEATSEATPDAPEGPGAGVKVVQSDVGRILADQSGRTLYGFTKDKDGASNCDADCIAVWPALISPAEVAAGEGVEKSLLRQTEQGEGVIQATYGEWPLYYYVADAKPGDINGQGVDDEWFVVAPDGKLIKKSG
ncbi:hypothetical protein [Streptomyces gobiensis]|uniref:COG4315 family predicted lipoprotein n=1 Tax=Streptomyces gobiensis TaxID=2875706 RepID=UPI001E43F880|nr:hypothetical protein [Streptomyces gobiensis]UGY90302.1 hypothetical protein test1122_00205 [Streptomyces gobiensis]